MRIDRDLIAAAAERSRPMRDSIGRNDIESWIRSLPDVEKNRLLVDVALDGTSVQAELLKRFRDASRPRQSCTGNARNVAHLLAAAERRAHARQRKEEKQAERERARHEREAQRARERYLKDLAKREAEVWLKIDRLIMTKQPKNYDEAVTLLNDLRDLGRRDGKTNAFAVRIRQIHAQHQAKPTFIRRLRNAGLLDSA